MEAAQTIAMVLAEMVASGGQRGQEALKDVEIAPHRAERMKGARFADGLAYGVAVLHEAPVAASQLLSDDPAAEEARLSAAILDLRNQIDGMLDGHQGILGASYDVLEAYKMLAHSSSWNHDLEEAVRSGLTAEAAVERVRSEHRARIGQARDPYLRERLHDLEDLNDRLLRHLSGEGAGERALPDNAILIARNLGPADLLEYDRAKLRGLLLEEGSSASHAAIVAKALDIPCVGRLAGLRDRVNEGDPVIVDVSASITTNGLTNRLAKQGRRLPHAWLLDGRGIPSDDPAVLSGDPKGTITRPTITLHTAADPLVIVQNETVLLDRYRAQQLVRMRRITGWVKHTLDDLRRRGTGELERGFVVHRTLADPRFLDPALEPNGRRPGWCYMGDPETVNSGPVGLARFCTLRSWLSQWSIDDTRGDALADNIIPSSRFRSRSRPSPARGY